MRVNTYMTNIIFDTNAARDFVEGIGQEELERFANQTAERFDEKELRLFVSPIVIQELLYHLVDHSDRDFSVSFKAVKAMMLVVERQCKDERRPMMSPMELLIANEVYHMHSESREKMYAQLMSIAEYVAHHSIDEVPDLHTIDGGTVKTYVDEIEEGFANQIREVCGSVEFLASQLGHSFEGQLNTPDTENLLVTYFSRTTYNLLMNEGKLPDYHTFLHQFVPYTPESFKKEFEFVQFMQRGNREIIRRYPAFLKLVKEVVRRIHQSRNQISDDKLKNYVWDIALMFHVNNHTVDHEPFRFITTDKTMLVASGAFHDAGNVMNYKEFKEWMESESN